MTPEEIKFLNDNLDHYMVLVRAFYIRGLMGSTRTEMERIIRDNFQPGYHTDLYCTPCITDMVRLLYRLYHDWLRKETGDNEAYTDIPEAIKEMIKKIPEQA